LGKKGGRAKLRNPPIISGVPHLPPVNHLEAGFRELGFEVVLSRFQRHEFELTITGAPTDQLQMRQRNHHHIGFLCPGYRVNYKSCHHCFSFLLLIEQSELNTIANPAVFVKVLWLFYSKISCFSRILRFFSSGFSVAKTITRGWFKYFKKIV
jgi:hypothetical protein